MDDMRCAQNSKVDGAHPPIANGVGAPIANCDSRRDQLSRQANGCGYDIGIDTDTPIDNSSFLNTADAAIHMYDAVCPNTDEKRDNCRYISKRDGNKMEESYLLANDAGDVSDHDIVIGNGFLEGNPPSNGCCKPIRSNSAHHVQFDTPYPRSPQTVQPYMGVDTGSSHKRDGMPRKLSKILSRLQKNTSQSDGILPDLRKTRRRWRSSSSTSIGSTSTATSESRTTEFERTAPDGGWGWVVVLASFMVHCIADGVTMSFGVLYVEFLAFFQESRAVTSGIGSLFMAIPLLAGPLASFATDKYGCRVVTIWGSMIACIGFILSAFANSVAVLFVTVGLITGVGLALCYVAAIVIVAFYFEKRRSLATGIAVAGSGIGTFVFAPLIHHLIEHYGWRGCLIILAGAFLNMAVCGLLMRDLEWTRKKPDRSRGRTLSESSDVFRSSVCGMPSPTQIKRIILMGKAGSLLSPDDMSVNVARSSSLVMLPTFLKRSYRIPKDLLAQFSKTNAYEIVSQVYPDYLTRSASGSLTRLDTSTSCRVLPTVEVCSMKKNKLQDIKVQLSLHKEETMDLTLSQLCRSSSCLEQLSDKNDNINMESKAIVVESSLKNGTFKSKLIKTSSKCMGEEHRKIGTNALTSIPEDVLRIKRQSMTFRGAVFNIHRYRLRSSSCPNIYKNSALPRIQAKKQKACAAITNCWKEAKSCFTIERCCKLDFIMFAASNFILYVFYDTVYMYLSDYAQGVGMSPDNSAGLIAFIGILNCIGMVLMGYVADHEWSSPLTLYLFSMVFCGASVVVMPFLQSYLALSVAAAIFGLFISANYALTSVILVELTSLDGFSKAYGLLLLIQGIGNLVGPPFVGMLADATGEYVVPFAVSGTFIILCGLMLAAIPAVQRHRAAVRRTLGDEFGI